MFLNFQVDKSSLDTPRGTNTPTNVQPKCGSSFSQYKRAYIHPFFLPFVLSANYFYTLALL